MSCSSTDTLNKHNIEWMHFTALANNQIEGDNWSPCSHAFVPLGGECAWVSEQLFCIPKWNKYTMESDAMKCNMLQNDNRPHKLNVVMSCISNYIRTSTYIHICLGVPSRQWQMQMHSWRPRTPLQRHTIVVIHSKYCATAYLVNQFSIVHTRAHLWIILRRVCSFRWWRI